MALNLQEMAASAYSIIMNLQQQAMNTVGLDVLYCRATPEINSEDVILQEYTLTNIGLECPQPLKVLTANSDYNAGNFTIDLFGINYDAPLEINITISDWNAIFGETCMPQAGDVLYIKILHKLFEVKTSQVMYGVASMPQYYKCQLVKYNPVASRKETEEFRSSIEELTVTQEDLFGDAISQEVADAVVEVETSYNNTTMVDPLKDYDMDSVVIEDLIGTDGNRISSAYYDLNLASKKVLYHVRASYSAEYDRNHWIFTSWFRNNPGLASSSEYAVRSLSFYTKDKKDWYFKITATCDLNVGDHVTLSRGSLVSIEGEIVDLHCEMTLGIKFKNADVQRLNRKLTGWYEKGNFKLTKASRFNLIKSDNGSFSIDVNCTLKTVSVNFGGQTRKFDTGKTDLMKWCYIAVDMSMSEIRLVLCQLDRDANDTIILHDRVDSKLKTVSTVPDFEFESLEIDAVDSGLNIRNIRLYENEYPMEDTYKLDMYSEVTRNASKLIVVDGPVPPVEGMFYSPVR